MNVQLPHCFLKRATRFGLLGVLLHSTPDGFGSKPAASTNERATAVRTQGVVDLAAGRVETSRTRSTPVELAETAYRAGRFSEALERYALAANPETPANADPAARRRQTRLTDQALAGRAGMLARLGRRQELKALFEDIGDRPLVGRAGQEIRNAREGLHFMEVRPDISFLCGPTALHTLYRKQYGRSQPVLLDATSTTKGVSLAALVELAGKADMNYQAAKREPGAEWITPAVIHWKLDHYAALTEKRGIKYHVEDPTFVDDFWMTTDALEAESSGYFLIPAGPLPEGWSSVEPEEAAKVWGKGFVNARNTSTTRRSDMRTPKNTSCGIGMAVYSAHLHMVSLNLTDIPVSYSPAYGPGIAFEVNYVERDMSQPFTPTHGHLGPQWLHGYHSFIDIEQFDPANDLHEVRLAVPGGGFESHKFEDTHPDRVPGPFIDAESLLSPLRPEDGSRLRAVYLSVNGGAWQLLEYQRLHSDGTQLIYPAAGQSGIRVYLRHVRGRELAKAQLTLNYEPLDPQIPGGPQRLIEVVDAAGGVSQVLYADRLAAFPGVSIVPTTTDPLRIVGFLDPAGRLAEFRYDAEGRLEEIVDAEGISSSFAYNGLTDQIDGLTTPYGTSEFRRGGPIAGEPNLLGWLEMEDALGRVERVEYTQNAPGISPVESERPDEAQVLLRPRQTHQYRNTFYWDHQLHAKHPGDYTKAHAYHWLHEDAFSKSTGTLESYKAPLTSRVYYNYPGMTVPEDATSVDNATLYFPSKVAQLAEDGSTWLEQTQYNPEGNPTRVVDADGRELVIDYAPATSAVPAGIRPQSIKQNDKELVRYTYGDPDFPLLPTRIHHAGEAAVDLVYNSVGQVLSVTQDGDTFTYEYDQPDGADTKGRLLRAHAPGGAGVLATYAWTSANQLQSVTDSLGHLTAFTWDDLDRPVTSTHPDGTVETLGYGGRLFPETHIDRLGRLTKREYNAAGQLVEETSYGVPTEAALQGVDALTTRYEWCDCGSLSALIDPAGNRTGWEYDALGRVVRETDAAGRATIYEYGPRLGRLEKLTRPDGVETTYGYSPGGDLDKVDFSDGTTPGLRYDYDPDHGWLTTVSSVTPGTETVLESVTYQYNPLTPDATTAPMGAGMLEIETGAVAHSRVFFDYDNKGRVERRRQLNDSGGQLQVSNWTYDALNRLSIMSDPVAYQEFDYDGVSMRLLERWMYKVVAPATPIFMFEDYAYQTPVEGGRLTGMSRRIGSGGVPFTTYAYGYRDNDQLDSISLNRTGLPDQSQAFQYDSQLRLRDVGLTESGQPAGAYQFLHDKAGNRVTAIGPARTAHWQADAANQLQSQSGLGPRRIIGTVDEPSHVKVNGEFVPVDENLRFEAIVDTFQTRNVEIEATDFTGNVTTNSYWFAEPENTTGAVLRHDANGRLVEKEESNQITTYDWDALDRLLKVEQLALDGTTGIRRLYGYDPLSRMVKIETESWDGASWIASTPNYGYVYSGTERLQKRTPDYTAIYSYYYPDGVQNAGGNYYFYGRDHLGSITELIEVPTGNVVSRREYSPYGEVISETGTVDMDHGFTGHFYDEVFQLHHAPARVYDASLGRWLTPDPLPGAQRLPEGTNLYTYVGNDPVNYTDPFGFCRQSGSTVKKRSGPPTSGGGNRSGGGPPRRVAASASPADPGRGEPRTSMSFYHSTSEAAVDPLIKGGFRTDIPNPQVAFHNNRFGRGVYLSDSAAAALAERPGGVVLNVEASLGRNLNIVNRGPITDSSMAKAIGRGARKHGFDSITTKSVQPNGGINTIILNPANVRATGVLP